MTQHGMSDDEAPDWPPAGAAHELPDGVRRQGSTGQLFVTRNGQWIRLRKDGSPKLKIISGNLKPFRGIISGWYRDGDVVCGDCQYHPEMLERPSADAILNNTIVKGHPMHTSRIEKIEDRGSFSICETKNSFYVLIGPR